MADYGPETYGDRWAEIYDQFAVGIKPDTDQTVEVLAELAGGGPALELAIGTGRVAIPLAARGIEVHGVDASEAMVQKLRAKPGGADIPVTIGDFADVPVDGTYPLIFVVFNTLFALASQKDQVRCFQNVAAHLDAGGVFVIEAFVPDVTRFDRGQRVDALRVDADSVHLSASQHDPVTQRITSMHLFLDEDGLKPYPVQIRYAWPSELDLMARLAGLRLRDRWASWARTPFGPDAQSHVSVYERAG